MDYLSKTYCFLIPANPSVRRENYFRPKVFSWCDWFSKRLPQVYCDPALESLEEEDSATIAGVSQTISHQRLQRNAPNDLESNRGGRIC